MRALSIVIRWPSLEMSNRINKDAWTGHKLNLFALQTAIYLCGIVIVLNKMFWNFIGLNPLEGSLCDTARLCFMTGLRIGGALNSLSRRCDRLRSLFGGPPFFDELNIIRVRRFSL